MADLNKLLEQLKLEEAKAALAEARARAVEARVRSENAKADLAKFVTTGQPAPKKRR